MEVSDKEKERILDEQIYAAMRLLAVIYPPGCKEKINLPDNAVRKKSENKLTLRSIVVKICKLIDKRRMYMKRFLMIFIAALLFASCSNGVYIKVDKEFTVKNSENEKAWSRAHGWVFKNGFYEFQNMDNYALVSKNHDDFVDLGILREQSGGDYKYTLILEGYLVFYHQKRDQVNYKMKQSGHDNNRIYKKELFETVATAQKRWEKESIERFQGDLEKIKNYILTGEEQ